jgi:hypothetical protein
VLADLRRLPDHPVGLGRILGLERDRQICRSNEGSCSAGLSIKERQVQQGGRILLGRRGAAGGARSSCLLRVRTGVACGSAAPSQRHLCVNEATTSATFCLLRTPLRRSS